MLSRGQESSPAPQFESINSSALSLLYGPALTSVHEYWKKHSFDYTDFVGKVMSLLFNTLPIRKLEENHRFSSKEKASFNFMAEYTVIKRWPFGLGEYFLPLLVIHLLST